MPDAGREIDAATRHWIADAIGRGTRVVRVRRLTGGTSSDVDAIDTISDGGVARRVVLRRYVDPAVLASEPRAVEREAAVLRAVSRLAPRVPELIASDADATSCPVPTLLMTRVAGRPRVHPRSEMTAYLEQLAAPLPEIHATPIPTDAEFPTYRRYYAHVDHVPPRWARRTSAWERAIAVHGTPPPTENQALIHRDYHPGNVLWRERLISGIVDWAWACRGPRSVDVAHCRLNLALRLGVDAADTFLRSWQRRAGTDEYDPSWDLRDAVDALPDIHETTAALDRLDQLVARSAALV